MYIMILEICFCADSCICKASFSIYKTETVKMIRPQMLFLQSERDERRSKEERCSLRTWIVSNFGDLTLRPLLTFWMHDCMF
mmetsp:Transcript_38072/g.38428  ORF Transcript_38072/g.38428 Transcript_38072/m.38428 type:complete len:82 (+) Transcript_38072:1003-1248(+)